MPDDVNIQGRHQRGPGLELEKLEEFEIPFDRSLKSAHKCRVSNPQLGGKSAMYMSDEIIG